MSDNVTRYSILDDALDAATMEPDHDGAYVKYDDFSRLLAENAELRAERDKLYSKTISLETALQESRESDSESVRLFRTARDERDALKAEVERLRTEWHHVDGCAIYDVRGARPCTCGLEQP